MSETLNIVIKADSAVGIIIIGVFDGRFVGFDVHVIEGFTSTLEVQSPFGALMLRFSGNAGAEETVVGALNCRPGAKNENFKYYFR